VKLIKDAPVAMVFTSCALAALFALCVPAVGASFERVDGMLLLRGGTYEIGFDERTGAIAFVKVHDGARRKSTCATSKGGSLWVLQMRDGTMLRSSDFANQRIGRVRHERLSQGLRMTFEADAATVRVDIIASDNHVDFTVRVANPTKDVLAIGMPASLTFSPAIIKRVIFPSELGIALKRGFFEPQHEPTGWQTHSIGPRGLQRIANVSCVMRPDDDAPVNVTVTERGHKLLGDALVREWQSRKRIVNRPPQQKPDLEFITSEHGAFLAGHRIGNGLLFRFGGRIRSDDGMHVIRSVEHITAILKRDPKLAASAQIDATRSQIILLVLRNGPPAGGWTEIRIDAWKRAFASSAWLRSVGLKFAVAETVEQMLEALRGGKAFAIVNPYGEWFPVGTERWEAVADTIRKFISDGGVWFETGGYSFFYALIPRQFYAIQCRYPPAFSDFVHIESVHGAVSIFGIQGERDERHIFVPAEWKARADKRGGYVERLWRTFVGRGETWQTPTVRMLIGRDVVSALREYACENGYVCGLAEKMRRDVLKRWKRSVLVKYTGGTFADQMRMLDELPVPTVVHLVDYLHGGFDKQYPDHLPPHPSKGTPQQFKALIQRARELGHLVMPYTNPTWWCDDPKGPTFIKHGNAPLLRRLDGKLQREQYGRNWGWSICPWHPAVIEAADRICEQFTREYPVDILFQDQVGARGMQYDTNPASPTPYAYTQGIINLAKRAAKAIPVSTENGFDRLINTEAQFCGITWQLVPTKGAPPWRRLYRDWLSDDVWEFFPLAHFIAHDKVIFAHHDLGQFVTDRETLVWTLAIGYEMSYATSPFGLKMPHARNWLLYLDRIQKAIASRYIGAPLISFRYLKGSGSNGVLESVFRGVRIIANLTNEPFAHGNVVIAPMGFHAIADDAEAGIFTVYAGRKYEPEDLWLICERSSNHIEISAFTRTAVVVAVRVDDARKWSVKPRDALVGRGANELRLRFAPAQVGEVQIPSFPHRELVVVELVL